MGIGEALFYFAFAYFVLPKTRNDLPMYQMAFDGEMFFLRVAEISFYQASMFELYKSGVCFSGSDYGVEKGWCTPSEALQ